MKKIIIIASLSSFINQFEKNNIKLLKELNYKIYIGANDLQNLKKIEDINIFNIPLTRFPLSFGNIKGMYKLIKFIKKNNIDIIDCHTPTGGVLGRIIGKILKKKVIYTAHGFHFFKKGPILNWIIYFPIEYILSFFTDILITINNEDYKLANKFFKTKYILKIPGVGLNIKKFLNFDCNIRYERKKMGITEKDIVLISIGELSSRKNHSRVIKALGELQKTNIYYLIIGEGKSKKKYENLIKKNKLEQNVFLLGKKSNIEYFCKISDIIIHPSIREGLGIAALEGMASGLPLIASNINGIKDYAINKKTGYNINPKNIEEIKKAIIDLAENPVLRKKYGKYNQKKVKEFDIKKTSEIMYSLYKNL
ncbi:MAG: glycosyltransferase [Cetobacterium sp.]|nr:glycosyltransferase [Cetobacterium sp.]